MNEPFPHWHLGTFWEDHLAQFLDQNDRSIQTYYNICLMWLSHQVVNGFLMKKFKMIVPCCKQLWLWLSPMGIPLGHERTDCWSWLGHQLAMWTQTGHYISLSQISFFIYKVGRIRPASPSFLGFYKDHVTWHQQKYSGNNDFKDLQFV